MGLQQGSRSPLPTLPRSISNVPSKGSILRNHQAKETGSSHRKAQSSIVYDHEKSELSFQKVVSQLSFLLRGIAKQDLEAATGNHFG